MDPFLYTILTKQLRRDFYLLASRFGLCTGKALRFRPAPCNHMAYYNRHHRYRHAKFLATIGSTTINSGSSSNCQSMIPAGCSDFNATNTSNSYSASISQLSNSMYNDSFLNSRGRQGKIHRYYYRNPYPHHHFSVSKQYKEIEPPFEPCCSKYKRKDHEKHMHCYHHHHKRHPHSAPVSQVNESISIGPESNSETNAATVDKSVNKANNHLNLNKYLNNALSTSILYTNNHQNLSSCSSSTDYCTQTVAGEQAKCTSSTRGQCPNCTNKKSMIKYLALFKNNYLFYNREHHQEHPHNLHNRQDSNQQNEIGSLTTGTTYDSTFTTTTNNPTALTQLSVDSSIFHQNGHSDDKKPNQIEPNNNLITKDKLLDYSTTTITQNTAITQSTITPNNRNNKTALQTANAYKPANQLANGLTTTVICKTSQPENQQRPNSKPQKASLIDNTGKTKLNCDCNKKPGKKAKPIKFKFKLSTSKQPSKTNEFELHKLKTVKASKLINDRVNQKDNDKLLKPTSCLEVNQANGNQVSISKEIVILKDDHLVPKDCSSAKPKYLNAKESIYQQDDQAEDVRLIFFLILNI